MPGLGNQIRGYEGMDDTVGRVLHCGSTPKMRTVDDGVFAGIGTMGRIGPHDASVNWSA